MALETATFVSDLVGTNPVGATDKRSQGDDHLRLLKTVLKATFPNASTAFYFPTAQAKSGNYTVIASDANTILLVDASGGAITISLTAAATLTSRFRCSVMKVDATANAVTIDPAGAELINGAATLALSSQYEMIDLTDNGSAWLAQRMSASAGAPLAAGPLSVHGRSVNSAGNIADISATAASGAVLRESGSTIGWGTIATAAIGANQVTAAKIFQGIARSVLGVTGNAGADHADIQGTANQVLRVDAAGTGLAFGTAAIAGGGTGQTTAQAAFDALSPVTTRGDIIFRNATNNARLAAGTSGQFLKTQGNAADPIWADAFVKVVLQTFTSGGTYTPTTGMMFALLGAVGGGAGGGGVAASSNIGSGGGGGGGSTALAIKSAAAIGASQTVTIGAAANGGAAGANDGTAGNDSSIGALVIGKGGTQGLGAAANTGANGGAGGVAGTGDILIPGEAGHAGQASGSVSTPRSPDSAGGMSGLGFGAGGVLTFLSSSAGANGSNYGGGGSGATDSSSGGAKAGGNGAQGYAFALEFCKV